MSYLAPLARIKAALDHAGLGDVLARPEFQEHGRDTVDSILDEAGRFAAEVIAPLNRPADLEGARLADGAVRTPKGFPEAYAAWSQGGWNAVAGPADWGGMGLPALVNAACMEMWTSACMAFALGPVVTQGAAEVLEAHASPELQSRYLAALVSGEWAATMALTEPQAGSDLGLLRTRAEPRGDGTYALTGEKIFITYGDHDLTDNIVHMVLARLPDAPPGTRGISLFLAPKVLPDGSRNGLRCAGLEHKLGIHGSPTCSMVFDGAAAWLVGEPHKGLACMFTMMNRARLATGLQGVAIGERAYQQALAFAQERRQGQSLVSAGPSPIVEHPDVQRNLLTMLALVSAGRALAYEAAAAIDARDEPRAALLTPMVKAYCSEIGFEVASIGVQIHGGMGYVEETGAAQHLRDARIPPIYEGTNGIQAIDLTLRKVLRDQGGAARAEIARLRAVAGAAAERNDPRLGKLAARLREAVEALDAATGWLLQPGRGQDALLASATPYLQLFASTAAGAHLAKAALGPEAADEPVLAARFYAENRLAQAPGLARIVVESSDAFAAAPAVLAL